MDVNWKSRSSFSAICLAKGLVGGMKTKLDDVADCDIARALDCGMANPLLLWCGCSDRAWRSVAGNEGCHGATGEVESTVLLVSSASLPSFFSRKSPECRADFGRSISIPALKTLRVNSGEFGRDVRISKGGSNLDVGLPRDDGCGELLLSVVFCY